MPGSGSSMFQRNQLAQLNERLSVIEDVLDQLVGGSGAWGGAVPLPVVDPGPEDFGRTRTFAAWRRPGPIGDPAVYDLVRLRDLATQPEFANFKVAELLQRIRPHHGGDPGPSDIVRLPLAELEEQLHRVGAQKIRLESLEKMLTDRISELKKTAGRG